MKYLLFLSVLLNSCASSSKIMDRENSQGAYEKQETKNQEQSLARSEIKMKITSLGSKIRAIDTQIANQRQVIKIWEAKPEVASSEAMVANAKARIENLEREKEVLVDEQNEWKEKLH